MEDVQHDPRISKLNDQYLRPFGITSMLDAGVVIDGTLVGVVSTEHIGKKRSWHADEESFVNTMASLVAKRLVEAERKRTDEKLKESQRLTSNKTFKQTVAVPLRIQPMFIKLL